MNKNLVIKITLIIVLVIAGSFLLFAGAVSTIYIAGKTRMWILTRDMTGGTSLVYEIDTRGLSDEEKKDISQRMIVVLRRRIDPRGILPIVWRTQGNTRFEIQIPPKAGQFVLQDVKRMLKGAGILEFRILPTQGHPSIDMDQVDGYVERLKEKGPKYASDTQYVWCEIENINEWNVVDKNKRPSIVAQSGDKYYVLASNKTNETMLHRPDEKQWKLERANPTTDNMGRRAIGFLLDARGGKLFSNITGKNIGQPLCILLDEIAISAPNISDRIRRKGVITGSFTQTQIEDMVNKLNAGSLPARLIEPPISIETIGQDDPR
jgi:preprotein translocase subunit SecD